MATKYQTELGKQKAKMQEIISPLVLSNVMRRERIKPSDPNFKDKVSPYLAGEIDPSIAVHHDLDVPDNVMLNKAGYSKAKYTHYDSGEVNGKHIQYKIEPNTVGTVHTNNTPYVYGHEYRHHNFPKLSESENRLIDLIAAQTDIDVDESLRRFAQDRNSYYGRGKTSDNPKHKPSETLLGYNNARHKLQQAAKANYHDDIEINNHVIETSKARNEYEAGNLIYNSKTMGFLNDARQLHSYNEGLKDRNTARKNQEPETMADSLRAAYGSLWGDERFQ